MFTRLVNIVLEFMWNNTIHFHQPIDYFLFTRGHNRIVVKDVMVKYEKKRLVFSSQQLSYVRKGKFGFKKVRQYKVEVIDSSSNDLDVFSSKIYLVPELCSRVFKNTLVPHSCAINFVIAKIQLEQ